jgi:hypothetical protein
MQAGPLHIIGEFHGSHFLGRTWQMQPGCTYALSLELVA